MIFRRLEKGLRTFPQAMDAGGVGHGRSRPLPEEKRQERLQAKCQPCGPQAVGVGGVAMIDLVPLEGMDGVGEHSLCSLPRDGGDRPKALVKSRWN